MKKLLAVGLVLALSACGGGAPDIETENTTVATVPQLSDAEIEQRKIKAESDRILAEAQAEYAANHEAELEYVDMSQLDIRDDESQVRFDVSKSELLALCQVNIKNSMKNPKSFDMNYSSSQLTNTTDGYGLKFSYTGTNSFNATIASIASCDFDKSGRLVDISST